MAYSHPGRCGPLGRGFREFHYCWAQAVRLPRAIQRAAERSGRFAFGRALDSLCKSRLCGLTAVAPVRVSDWRAREPQGAERQVQTLLIDLGACCGEVGIRCAPKYGWAIDETR